MDNSSFGDYTDFFSPSDITPVSTNGATSDTYIVRISGKWHFLKRPKKELDSHPQYLKAFEKEFDLGFTLDHPNIVRYISKGYDKSGFYFLTEYVEGLPLTDFLKQYPDYLKRADNRERFIRQLLDAVDYLHRRQILHLDIKPDNLLITTIGQQVKIIDLGFAYSDCYQFFTAGHTNSFAAPEQLQKGNMDQRTDIYALGKLLSCLPKLSRREKACIRKCLSPKPQDRYQNIEELSANLLKKRHPLAVGLVSLAGIALFLLGFYLYQPDKDRPEKILSNQVSDPVAQAETQTETQTDPVQKLPVVRDTIVIKELILPAVETVPTPAASPQVDPVQAIIEQFRAELQKTYALQPNPVYSLEARYRKWKATQSLLEAQINQATTDEERENLTKLLHREENIRSAAYIQQSVIAELKAILATPLPEEKTPETVLLAFNQKIAPYYLPFYQKYLLIDDYVSYIRAKNELEEIKKTTEPILHAIYPNHPEVYPSREVFYEKFMARLPNYPYYNYIYPAEDLLRNYLFIYGEQ